jgi:hypothetical protein
MSAPTVFDEFGSETSWLGLSRHAGAHGEFGATWIECDKSVSMNKQRTDVTARIAMLQYFHTMNLKKYFETPSEKLHVRLCLEGTEDKFESP